MKSFEHVRAGFGVRQQCSVPQGCGGDLQVAFRHVLKVETDQIHHPAQREFEFGAQMRGAKIIGDLNDAFREFLLETVQPRWREDSMLSPVTQRLVEKWPVVERRKCGSGSHASSPYMADSS